MQEHDLMSTRRARLEAEMERARQHVLDRTAHARETMADAETDPTGHATSPTVQWGHWAMYFCIWFAMIAPIVLFIVHWD